MQWSMVSNGVFSMTLDLYLAFVGATVVLMLIPGPNVGLIVANSLAHGSRYGLMTVAGTSSAMAIQLAAVTLGMTTLLGILADVFQWLRWIGVVYLFYLAISALRSPIVDLTKTRAEPRSMTGIYLRGLLVSLTNPKTLLFYSVLLPQFVVERSNILSQLLLLSVTFLALALLIDSLWAVLSAKALPLLGPSARLRNRLTASFYLCAGFGLALARKP